MIYMTIVEAAGTDAVRCVVGLDDMDDGYTYMNESLYSRWVSLCFFYKQSQFAPSVQRKLFVALFE